MFSNFKALLVAGVALPALVGVAFAQGAATSNSVSTSTPSVKSDTAVSTPAVKADTKLDASAKSSKAAPASEAAKAPGKTSMVRQHNLAKHDVKKTSAAGNASASKIARGPATPPKAGDVAIPGSAAPKP